MLNRPAALAQEGAEGLIANDEPANATYRTLIIGLAEKGLPSCAHGAPTSTKAAACCFPRRR
jgi:hypothetical protein